MLNNQCFPVGLHISFWTYFYFPMTMWTTYCLSFCFCFATCLRLGLKKSLLLIFLLNKNKNLTSPKIKNNFFNPSQQCYQNFVYFVQIVEANVTYQFFIQLFPYRLLKIQRSLLKQKSRVIWRTNFRMSDMPGNLG